MLVVLLNGDMSDGSGKWRVATLSVPPYYLLTAWIAIGITFTPGGFHIIEELEKADGGSKAMFYDSFGLSMMVIPLLPHMK